jgi:hypothetical protein
MNNEPVAWMIRRDEKITKGIGHEIQLTLMDATRPEFWIKGKIAKGYEVFPLYTHPAKCSKCNDTEWVCENHPDQEAHKCIHCGGAGKPCECTHPAKTLKDREADRKRFSDEGFNRWLDESISDSGHTVYDLVENICEAWHGWENSQYYRPAKTLTDEEIREVWKEIPVSLLTPRVIDFARAILRKAQEK